STDKNLHRAPVDAEAVLPERRVAFSLLTSAPQARQDRSLDRRSVSRTTGGVSAFLCGGGSKGACPTPSGTAEGTIVPADVVGPAGQGIAAGEFAELVRAIRDGYTYANVHTTKYASGEIRGQIGHGKGHDDQGN